MKSQTYNKLKYNATLNHTNNVESAKVRAKLKYPIKDEYFRKIRLMNYLFATNQQTSSATGYNHQNQRRFLSLIWPRTNRPHAASIMRDSPFRCALAKQKIGAKRGGGGNKANQTEKGLAQDYGTQEPANH
jgi:hypothetical protein